MGFTQNDILHVIYLQKDTVEKFRKNQWFYFPIRKHQIKEYIIR